MGIERKKNLRISLLEDYNLGPVHTNPLSNENGAVLLRFQIDLRSHLSFSYHFRPSTLQRRIRSENVFIPFSVHVQMYSTRVHFNISAREIGAILDSVRSVCPPFWIHTVEWSGAF